MNKLIVQILFSFTTVAAFSQNYVDLLKLNAATTPNNGFKSSSSATKINSWNADLTLPIKLNTHSLFITGVIFENFTTRLFADSKIAHFGSLTLKAGLDHQFNERLSATIIYLPKIASDWASFNKNDIQHGAIAFMKIKMNKQKNFKLGCYYNTELFGPFFAPIIGMYYLSPGKKFETSLLLPFQADVNYKLHPVVHLGLNFNGQIRSYHLNNLTSVLSNTYIARTSNEFSAYLKFNISHNLNVITKFGRSVGRSYRVYDTSDKVHFAMPGIYFTDKRQQLNTDFNNGFIFQIGLNYRVFSK